MEFIFGPYGEMGKAADAAYNLVDGKQEFTLWSVIEVFGPGFETPARDGSGETWGTLYVVPDDDDHGTAWAVEQIRGAEFANVVDTYGYLVEDLEEV